MIDKVHTSLSSQETTSVIVYISGPRVEQREAPVNVVRSKCLHTTGIHDTEPYIVKMFRGL